MTGLSAWRWSPLAIPCARPRARSLPRRWAAPWSVAVALALAACQSSEIPPWLQGETAGRPPSEATRMPVQRPQTPPSPLSQVRPRPVPHAESPTQRMPPAGQYPEPPFPLPTIPFPPADDGNRATAPGAEPQLSFVPLLSRAPKAGTAAAAPRSTIPPPLSKDIVRVALLLPLSGANADLGKAMLDAAQMAVFDFADSRFELLSHDTRGTAAGAAAAASVAIGDGASVILGPLLAASVRAVAPVARAANVPVVAFSSDRSVAGNGVYTLGFLPSAEIRRIVSFARAQGIIRFAALAPENAYGETVVGAFEDAVAANGGTVTRIQFYDPGAEDFTEPVRALANYSTRRQALLDQRRALEGRDDEVSKHALKRLERLQTIGELPFDALLVADGGKRLQTIAALLPFFDIDPSKVRMLGTGQWDERGIGAEPALIGGWFAAPPPSARSDFETAFRALYGKNPPRLATLAYDATALAAVLARSDKGPDFSATAITSSSGFWGRDGIFRFLPQGTAERGLAVMRVTRHGAEIISRAPETFQAAIN
ncbi:MAG: penicillin-binding protein activator [Rhodospirillales bacterium]|nr:penicillin-binding protein activator [Rhodospirillales bacterium]